MYEENYIKEEDIKTLLDFFVSDKYEYTHLNLNKKEFYEIEEFVRKHLFIIKNEEEDRGVEYLKRLIFIYKGKLLMLYELKSYSSDLHIMLLSKNV
jgi:hypothetical protein